MSTDERSSPEPNTAFLQKEDNAGQGTTSIAISGHLRAKHSNSPEGGQCKPGNLSLEGATISTSTATEGSGGREYLTVGGLEDRSSPRPF